MLTRLKIVNFLLIDELELDFSHGLTVVTGETGSGKSIIVDALMIVFGAKVPMDVIRHKQNNAVFEAEFNLKNKYAIAWLIDNDLIDHDNEDNLLCKRIIDKKNSRNKIYVNGHVVTLSQARQISEFILDVHTQHASITLLKPDIQRNLLDEYANITTSVQQLNLLYKLIYSIENDIKILLDKNKENDAKKHELEIVYEDLSSLSITEGEWKDLEINHKELSNAQFILQELNLINNIIDSQDESIKDIINKTASRLEKLENIFPKCSNARVLLEAVDAELGEATHEINYLANSIEQNPEKLTEVEFRMNSIFSMCRKYKINPDDISIEIKVLESQLKLIEQSNNVDNLKSELAIVVEQYKSLSANITQSRIKAASELSAKITALLHKLAITGEFKAEVVPTNDMRSFGMENVEFKVCFNKGMELQALDKAASGGELSRTALALYLLLSLHNPPEVIIFDEIDVGIGGKVAAIVGKMLSELGNDKQVICITHQPQTASYGLNHLVVSKYSTEQASQLAVKFVRNEDRIRELARMLSGMEITEATLLHAKELLETN